MHEGLNEHNKDFKIHLATKNPSTKSVRGFNFDDQEVVGIPFK